MGGRPSSAGFPDRPEGEPEPYEGRVPFVREASHVSMMYGTRTVRSSHHLMLNTQASEPSPAIRALPRQCTYIGHKCLAEPSRRWYALSMISADASFSKCSYFIVLSFRSMRDL